MSTVFIMPQEPEEAILATAAIEALKGGDNPVFLVCAPKVAPLFYQDSRFAEVFSLEIKTLFRRWKKTGLFLAEQILRRGPFDAVINLDDTTQSAWLAARIPAKNRVGYKTPWAPPFIWRKLLKPDPKLHRAAHYGALAAALEPDTPAGALPRLGALGAKSGDRLRIGLMPSGKERSILDWGAHRWAETALNLSREAEPVLIGLSGAEFALERMDEVLGYNGQDDFERISSRASWQQLRAAIGSLDLAIATEGVLMQAALALGVPTVAIFGPGNPALTGPQAGQRAKTLYKNQTCSPCKGTTCAHLHPACLEGIAPSEVLAAAWTLLKP